MATVIAASYLVRHRRAHPLQEVTHNMVMLFGQTAWFRRYHCSPAPREQVGRQGCCSYSGSSGVARHLHCLPILRSIFIYPSLFTPRHHTPLFHARSPTSRWCWLGATA